MADRVFYRLCGRNLSANQFRSDRERGFPLDDPTKEPEWRGVSVWETQQQAVSRSNKAPGTRIYVAELRVPTDGSVEFARTQPDLDGHHTIWATAEQIYDLVRSKIERLR
jgi:hypothetical protein